MELDARMPGETASYPGEYQRKLSIARTVVTTSLSSGEGLMIDQAVSAG
jgi:hypothetical protein